MSRVTDYFLYRFGININLLMSVFLLGTVVFGGGVAILLNSGSSPSGLKDWVYWEYRALRYDGHDSPHSPLRNAWANIDGLTKEGKVLLRVYEDGIVRQITPYFADLELADKKNMAIYINGLNKANVMVDYYHLEQTNEDYVVVWLEDGSPLNMFFVQQGWATPTNRPPTNIINTLMAQFYKKQWKGE